MASAIGPLTPAELSRIAGPLLLAHLFSWALFGVLAVQVYIYYLAFPKDRIGTKSLVYTTFTIELIQTIMLTETAFSTFGTGFANLQSLNSLGTTWFSVPPLGGIVGFLAQSFYAYRISVLAQNKYASTVIMLLALLQVSAAITLGVQVKDVLYTNLLKTDTYITAGIWEGGSAICDVVIAGCMIYYLRRRRDTGLKQTRALVQRIMRLSIETGTLTASVAILTLAVTFLPSKPTYYQTSVTVLGKMYSNSMMVSLNSRMKIASFKTGTISTTIDAVELPSFGMTTVKVETITETGMQGLSSRGEIPYSSSDTSTRTSHTQTRDEKHPNDHRTFSEV